MNKNKDFKLTEPVILTLEKEKEDSKLLKKYRRNKTFRIVYKKYLFITIFSITLVISLYYLLRWNIDNKKTAKIIETVESCVTTKNLSNENDSAKREFKVNFDKLKAINNTCFGWICVNNTEISYPVVQYTNNDFYLQHSFDQSMNSAGWIFADYRNSCDGFDKNLIIYGHNRKDGSMFKPLNEVCLNEDWYKNKENQIIKLYTESRFN